MANKPYILLLSVIAILHKSCGGEYLELCHNFVSYSEYTSGNRFHTCNINGYCVDIGIARGCGI